MRPRCLFVRSGSSYMYDRYAFVLLGTATPMGNIIVITHGFRRCSLRVGDNIRSAYLFPLEMSGFDIILGLPPEREVEFTIELIPRAQPISKAPVLSKICGRVSLLALPLTKLMRKGEKFFWNEEREKSFKELKRRLVSSPVLTPPSGTDGYQIYSDASKKGLSCVLMQHGKVIAYASRQLKPYEVVIQNLKEGKQAEFWVDDHGVIWYGNRLCVLDDSCLREAVLTEAHSSPFYIHPGSTKMYRDLKRNCWWNGMKHDVARLVAKCLTCQQVKIEHQRTNGLLQPLDIMTEKWEKIYMNYVMGLPRTFEKNDAIWVVVDRLTKSAYFLPIQ
uniref:Transposon Ty3-G Gag-Pol polyprotein n=1 Tax=Tanacetum cinerariifolium TaxID=118510 RepID=A0A6L2NA70_TANCI|nr:transposon Ty3-G Gag-Pol polyprotein [Tanacetum cinerariifolium]